eukprot:13663431-Alexandrium_andersonii.AAC.1
MRRLPQRSTPSGRERALELATEQGEDGAATGPMLLVDAGASQLSSSVAAWQGATVGGTVLGISSVAL